MKKPVENKYIKKAIKDEVVDKIMKTRVPVQTSHAELEEVEF